MVDRLWETHQELAKTRLAPFVKPVALPPEVQCLRDLSELYYLARAPSRATEQAILEQAIAIALVSQGNAQVLNLCAAVFARLGYFPSIDSLRKQFPAWHPQLPLRLQAEAAGRIVALAPHGDLATPYTPFQADLHEAFSTQTSASISAPTSSGKSFVLARLILDFATKQGFNVAYVVPTRALIAEVSGRIRSYLRSKGSKNPIRTSPAPLPGSGVSNGHVYVLTQERLLGLLGNPATTIHLDVLLVDEAHEVQQQSARGILLEAAIEAARRRYPKLRVLMAAPGIPNPDYLLGLTKLPRLDGVSHVDRRSPVLHNYLELRYHTETDSTDLVLHQEIGSQIVANLPLGNPYPESPAAWGAFHVHQPGHTTLVYCRSPEQADVAVDWLDKMIPQKQEVDAEVEALAQYIQKEIHPGHPLSDMLRKGLATHYGKLPPTVKSRIELLAGKGKLDIVCSTSTLLSGVNLPCRNLVMCDPRKGRGNGEPLTEAELRNLAGRAGRVDSDLVGNVWVVSLPGVPARIPSENLPPIQSAFEREIQSGGQAILDLANPDVKDPKKNEYASAFTARAFDLAKHGISLADGVPLPADTQKLEQAQAIITQLRASITVPPRILESHHAIAPSIIQTLLDEMLAIPPDKLRKWPPLPRRIHPPEHDELKPSASEEVSKYENVKLHFNKVMPYLAKAYKDPRYNWPEDKGRDKAAWRLATIAAHWINGVPLGFILQNSVKIQAKTQKVKITPPFIRDVVRDTMRTIEDDIRFRLAQQWRLVQDLLVYIYTEVRPDPEALEGMIDLHLRLEFGTISEEALDVMALGFSRATTKEIRQVMRKYQVSISKNAENVIDWLLERSPMEIRNWNMPPELWLELCVVAGRDPAEVVWETA